MIALTSASSPPERRPAASLVPADVRARRQRHLAPRRSWLLMLCSMSLLVSPALSVEDGRTGISLGRRLVQVANDTASKEQIYQVWNDILNDTIDIMQCMAL